MSTKSSSKKRKQIEDNLSNAENMVQKYCNDDQNNKITLSVQSSSDDNKTYNITILNTEYGIVYQCDCGDQWNIIPKRNNCKHIGATLSNLISIYVRNNFSVKQRKLNKNDIPKHVDELDLDELMDKFKKLL
jgi:hypothetical protein